jgi:hypothetical protein
VDVRSELVRALRLDAIGPDPGEPEATEALPQSPSEWYLTGFLVPYQAKAEDRQNPTSNEDVDEGGAAGGGDDPQDQEKPSARRAFLPSSLGLSVLVPKNAGSFRATVTWGDYRLVKPEETGSPPEGESAPKARAYWQRTPRSVEVAVAAGHSTGKPVAIEVPGRVHPGDEPGRLLNVHRPRDRSHYERFEAYHDSFYRAVEVTSVTPFAPRAIDRGLAAVIVGLARHGHAPLTPPRAALDIVAEQTQRRISEERLVAKIEQFLETPNLQLFAPPAESTDPRAVPTGVTAWQFPEWFIAQCDVRRGSARRRPLVHRQGLVKDRYENPDDGRRYPVVPIRFVQGCINGHLSDIDWYKYVHEGADPDCRRPLWVEERGSSGDIRDVFILCDCGRARSVASAALRRGDVLGFCRGQRPWLGRDAWERCGGPDGTVQPNRLLLRTASDAYFPQVQTAGSVHSVQAPWVGYAIQLRWRRGTPLPSAARATFTSSTSWKSYMPAHTKSAPFS